MRLRTSLRAMAAVPLVAVMLLVALAARADELTLKDGTKISGTIVGFEENSFKVKTSYGFAVVLKEQVASITVGNMSTVGAVGSDAKPSAAAAAKADAAATIPVPVPPTPPTLATAAGVPKAANAASGGAATNAATYSGGAAPSPLPATAAKQVDASKSNVASAAAPAAPVVTPVKQTAPETKPPVAASTLDGKAAKLETANAAGAAEAPKSSVGSNPAARAVAPTQVAAPAIAPTTVSAAAPKPAVAAPAPAVAAVAAVEPIREQVVGNIYTNATYGFQMYKPPTWEVIAGVPSVLPGAIAAMGTYDQTTYLLVGQEAGGSSAAGVKDATERRLRDIMDNFRALGESGVVISGGRATEFRFRGGVDGHDWSGVAVFVAHGARIYTIFGMTLADSDLVQIQENVIERAISSLQFTK